MGFNNTLFARTRYDVATMVLHDQVTADIIAYAKQRAYSYSDLSGDTANRSNFEIDMWKYNPQVVVISTHGSEEGLMGNDQITEILSPANSLFTKGKLCYFIACQAGKGLAPICVSNGARAVFGWDDDLTIAVYPLDGGQYELVDAFRESLTVPKLLYDGVKVKDVYQSTIDKFNEWIEHYDEVDPMIADILRHDRDHFVLHGNGEESVQLSWYLLMGLGDVFFYIIVFQYTVLQLIRMFRSVK